MSSFGWRVSNEWNSSKVLLAGDKFMPEMHLRHPRFTYSDRLQKTKKEYKNLRK